MKLSEAIRLGSMLRPQADWVATVEPSEAPVEQAMPEQVEVSA